MDINDAINILQKDVQDNLIVITIPSSGETIDFKKLTTTDYKQLYKTKFLDGEKVEEVIGSIIVTNSNGKVNLNNINEYDKTHILLKLQEVDNEVECKIMCEQDGCYTSNTSTFNTSALDNVREFGTNEIEFKDGEIDVKITLKEPSVSDNIYYNNFLTKIVSNIQEESDKILYKLYSATYEKNIIFIDTISLNGELVDGFSDLPFEMKLQFLDNFGYKVLSSDNITNYIDKSYANLKHKFTCTACKTVNNVIVKHSDFIYN